MSLLTRICKFLNNKRHVACICGFVCVCKYGCGVCQLVIPLPVGNKYFLSHPSTHFEWPPTLPMFSQRMPVEVVSCQGHQRSPLLHLAGTPHTSTSFLSPLHIGHDQHSAQSGSFFSSTKVLIHGYLASCWICSDSLRWFSTVCQCQNAWCSSVFGVIQVLKQGAMHLNETSLKKVLWGFYYI